MGSQRNPRNKKGEIAPDPEGQNRGVRSSVSFRRACMIWHSVFARFGTGQGGPCDGTGNEAGAGRFGATATAVDRVPQHPAGTFAVRRSWPRATACIGLRVSCIWTTPV